MEEFWIPNNIYNFINNEPTVRYSNFQPNHMIAYFQLPKIDAIEGNCSPIPVV